MNTKTTTMRSYIIHQPFLVARDESAISSPETYRKQPATAGALEQYYDDVYKLFLATLTRFDQKALTTAVERERLQSLFSEVVKIKSLLEQS